MQLVAVDYQAENAQEEFVKSLRETCDGHYGGIELSRPFLPIGW